ncbi:MAG: TonB-dependent receptor [Oceanicoccus sp.]
MNKSVSSLIAAIAVVVNATAALAADELIVHVSGNDQGEQNLVAVLDGNSEEPVDSHGFAIHNLTSGQHSIQIKADDQVIHSFRFSSASGQLVDVSVDLKDRDNPNVNVEAYFLAETVGDRKKAGTGAIVGQVKANGFPVANARVSLLGTDIAVDTDIQGRYQVSAPRGIYTLDIEHPDYGRKEIEDFRIVSGVTKGSNFSLSRTQQVIEEVTVVAKVNLSGFQESERYATNVIDTMDIEQLGRFGDSDVSSAVIRVPSVTVQDNQFIFIRGLGGRYITTTLNGATLPSTNPSKRTVPLDLFPSNIVEQLDIKKTFIASMPGESTGGNLVINTRAFPEEAVGKLSVSMGYVDGLTGDKAFVDPSNGDFDSFGWDDGERKRPVDAWSIAKALEVNDYYSDDVEQQLGRIAGLSIKDNFDVDTETAKPDISLGFNYGDLFYPENHDVELSYFVAGNYKNEWSKKDEGVRRSYGGDNASVVEDDFTFVEHSNNIQSNGLLSLGLNAGESTYQSNTVISHVTEERVRKTEGFDGDQLEESIRWAIEWVERRFYSQQFTGEHYFGESDEWTINWQTTASRAHRYAPDRREVRFNLSGNDGIYNLEVPNLSRRYDDLVDDNIDVSSDAEYMFSSMSDIESTLAFGLQYITRERDSESDTYGFRGGQFLNDNSENVSVSDVINSNSITGDTDTGYTFSDKTLASDSYDAEMDLGSAYVSYDALLNSEYQLVVGVRYEDYEQTTETFSLQGAQEKVVSNIQDDVFLPSMSLNWYFSEDQQLRIAVSETVSRPDFKETSFAVFYDNEFDFRVRGNPNLKVSTVTNYDLRWEQYWSDVENVSVALFYKEFKDPIERVVLTASGTAGNSRTFRNADSGEMWGIELDGRKDFPFNEAFTKSLFVALNASYIDSEVEIDNETSAFQGAPEYTFNLILGYDDISSGHELTLLLNQNGETVVDKGVSGQPDIVEEPRLSMNLNYKYAISDAFTFKAKVENILNQEVEFTQGGNVFQSYERGMKFKAGIDWIF